VAPATETTSDSTTVMPTAAVIASGTASAVLANDASAADGTASGQAVAATPADTPIVDAAATLQTATVDPTILASVPAATAQLGDSTTTAPPTAPTAGPGSDTTTAPTDPTAAAAGTPEVAAMQAAMVALATPESAAGPADATPVTVAPTAPASGSPVASETRTSTDTKDGGTSGSGAAPQAPTPAPAVGIGPDAVQPAVATTALDATQAPAPVVSTAVPTATAPVALTSELPQSLTTDRERFVRLVDGLEARLRVSGAEGGRAMSMTLRPAELGDVTVRLQIAADGQSATATLLAQNHQTGDLLAQAAGDLRQALADRGLRLDRLEVTAGPLGGGPGSDGAPSGAPDPNRQETRRTHYAFDARTDAVADGSTVETAAAGTTHEGLYVLA
jgi:flagellar hook-length control protein FliK